MLLEIRQGSFAFGQDKILLQKANLQIAAGQHTCLVGESGTGKSTVLKILANLLSLNSGQLLFQDQPVEDYHYSDYRRQVSYVMQNPALFGRTVRDNLAFPARIREEAFQEEEALNYMTRFMLKEIRLDQSIAELSGGEAQRVGLIRNLLYPPKILLLDEVTASLDPHNADNVWQQLLTLAADQGMTLVWVSHKLEERQYAQQTLELKADCGCFERIA